jgi:hypothetical protein
VTGDSEADEAAASAGAARMRPAASRRLNDPSINHKIYGEPFVKARVLACVPSGTHAGAGPSRQGIVASVET